MPEGCRDIAHQLIHGDIGSNLDVILGGGYREFIAADKKDLMGRSGLRTDGRDLIREALFTPGRRFLASDRVNYSESIKP